MLITPWHGSCFETGMPKIAVHVERKSRFLRALVPINPCEDIRFGMIDCIGIGFFILCFLGVICTLTF